MCAILSCSHARTHTHTHVPRHFLECAQFSHVATCARTSHTHAHTHTHTRTETFFEMCTILSCSHVRTHITRTHKCTHTHLLRHRWYVRFCFRWSRAHAHHTHTHTHTHTHVHTLIETLLVCALLFQVATQDQVKHDDCKESAVQFMYELTNGKVSG